MFYSLNELLHSSNSDLESFDYMEIGIVRKVLFDRDSRSSDEDSDSSKILQVKKHRKLRVAVPERKAS